MKNVTPYLNFEDNCREAMTFYGKCFEAEVQMMPFSEIPGADFPEEAQNRIMHASLTKTGTQFLMASDMPSGMPLQKGNNFHVAIQCESQEEVDKLFSSLGENGKVSMPLQDTFWGAYFGMLTDRFGVNWMFNFEHPK